MRSVVGLMDQGERAVKVWNYDAWGFRTVSWQAEGMEGVQPAIGYAGYLQHEDSGLCLMPARAYSPALRRWLSRDPIGLAGGDANLYAYVGGDPVNGVDPAGLSGFWQGLWQGSSALVALEMYSFSLIMSEMSREHPNMPFGWFPESSPHIVGAEVDGGYTTLLQIDDMWLIRPFAPQVTIGPVIFYAPGQHNARTERHERQHLPQSAVLGPAYLPINIIAQAASAGISAVCGHPHADIYHEWNPMEWGPMNSTPGPWRFEKPDQW